MSLDDESFRSIEMWILEHACKTRMEKVIDKILKKRIDDYSFFSPNVDHVVPLKSQNWIYLTVLIRSLDRELASLKKDLSCAPLCCNYDLKLSAKTVALFEKMYSECHFLPLKMFTNVVTRLRLLEIIVRIIRKEDANKIMKDMSASFPKESSSFKTNLQQQFKIESLNMANQMMSVYTCCRSYIVKLMAMTADKKERYLNENLPNELAEFAIAGRKYLREACGYIASQMPPSPLERICGGGSEELKYSDDHCVQILLQYLTDDITEDILLKVLKELDAVCEINLARISRRLSNIVCDDSFDEEEKTKNSTIVSEKTNSAVKDIAKRKTTKTITTEASEKKKVKVMLHSTPSLLADRYFSPNRVLKAGNKKKRVSRDSSSDSSNKNDDVGTSNNISGLSSNPVVLSDEESVQDRTIPVLKAGNKKKRVSCDSGSDSSNKNNDVETSNTISRLSSNPVVLSDEESVQDRTIPVLKAGNKKKCVSRDSASDSSNKNNDVGTSNNISRLSSNPVVLSDEESVQDRTIPVLKAGNKKKRVSRDRSSDSSNKNNDVGTSNNISRLSSNPVVLSNEESVQDRTIPEAECPEKDSSLESPVKNGNFFLPVRPCQIILRPKRTFFHEGQDRTIYS